MIPAQFILCGLWCGVDPLHGARTVVPEHGALHVGGGVNAVFPTLTLGATLGVSSRVDARFVYTTHGGVAHEVEAGARVRLTERWGLVHTASYGLFLVEEIGGIQSVHAPFGNGLTTTHQVVLSRLNLQGLHLAFTAGVTLRWLVPRQEFETVTLAFEPTLHTAHAQVVAEWVARSGGTWWLQVRATVPVQADFKLIGYFPMVLVGRSWALP